MGIIKELSRDVAKKIAATEVIERPVSVVKELVENSIDAGATMITVRIENGGITRIQVTDNGCGMMKEDAVECFKRHATSKIATEEDLLSIYTMGFRGEALSSVASVAQVDLYTKREQDETGTHVLYADGAMQACNDEGMTDGTTFVVANLFYNVPARMKFLKRDAVEASYITDIMARFILSHPEISFRYVNNRKEIYFSSGDNNYVNCIYSVYGKDFAKNVLSVNYEQNGIKVSGVIGKSETSRPNRNYQSFFVNKRYIKSPLMAKAIENAYKNQVMVGKYPMVALNIDIDASLIDVNSHPTKQEIKFTHDKENDVFTAIFHAVENTLHTDYSIPQIERKEKSVIKNENFKADIVKSDAQYELDWKKNKDRWNPAEEKTVKEKPRNDEEFTRDFPDTYKCDVSPEYFEKRRHEIIKEMMQDKKREEQELILNEPVTEPDDFKLPKSTTPFYDAIMKQQSSENQNDVSEKQEIKQEEKTESIEKNFRVIGQVFATYVIIERDNEMLLIDQHAAHERIKYEEIKKELEEKRVSSQDLLIPVTVKLSPVEYQIFDDNIEFLDELGFEAECFGENTIIVRSAPTYVDYDDVEPLLIELIEQISENKNKPKPKKTEYAVYTIACKAAVKANHVFDLKQLENLAEKVFELGSVNTCPHGRPITISMTKKELEKEFKRIV